MRGGGWDRPKASFQSGDYVLLQQKKKDCLQPPARPHILRVVELRPSGVVALEGSDAARVQRQVKDIAHSSLPILDPSPHPDRFYRGPNLHCRVCGCRNHASKMVLCDKWVHLVDVDILRLRRNGLKPMFLIPCNSQWRLHHQMSPMCGQGSRMLGYC